MFKKMALLTSVFVFSGQVNAGLFDSNSFKCGRDDAIKALSDYIKNDASGMLQSDYLTKSRFIYDKPVSVYHNMLNSMEVAISNVSTAGEGSYGLKCSANIYIKTPQDTLDVVSKAPGYLQYVTGGYGKVSNSGVIWNNVAYNAKLADNKKDILFSEFSMPGAADAMFNISVIAVNKDQIINRISEDSLDSAKSAYARTDRELNAVWKELPDSVQSSLKKEQIAWVNNKMAKCGKLSDDKTESVNVQQQLNTYRCQTKMTNDRIAYLTGNEN
ncbi:lysozyme inhibitor LprI family protein [Enterobacter kobei]|uniref:lysozyme inhibitor LprI family protein n=1 Tax=Enterobacter kobei TaxID=208224 RepID=UPI002FD54B1C